MKVSALLPIQYDSFSPNPGKMLNQMSHLLVIYLNSPHWHSLNLQMEKKTLEKNGCTVFEFVFWILHIQSSYNFIFKGPGVLICAIRPTRLYEAKLRTHLDSRNFQKEDIFQVKYKCFHKLLSYEIIFCSFIINSIL